jgi:Tfp pilus assembly protein PilZ
LKLFKVGPLMWSMSLPARTREILIVGPAHSSPEIKEKLSAHLNQAFHDLPGAPFQWDFLGVSTPKGLKSFVSSHEVPLLVLLDPFDSDLSAQSLEWDEVCDGLRKLDPLACILVISPPESPSAELGISWLDRGASGLLNLDAPSARTEDTLRDMLSLPLRVKVPRKLRVSAKHRVEIRVASFEQALVAETLNVGLGGLFIRTVPQNVAVGDEVEFILEFSRQVSGNSAPENTNTLVNKMNDDDVADPRAPLEESIRGLGTVVWVRSTAQNDTPEGIGLQFRDIDPISFKKIQEFVASHRIKAFIPRS